MACGRASGIHGRSTNPDALYPIRPCASLIRAASRYRTDRHDFANPTFVKSCRNHGHGETLDLGKNLSSGRACLSSRLINLRCLLIGFVTRRW